MLNNMNKAFIGDLLYRAYMIDAITDEEVKQACAMFEIKYPPSLLENQNVGEHETLVGGVHNRPVSSQVDYWKAVQGQQSEAVLAN